MPENIYELILIMVLYDIVKVAVTNIVELLWPKSEEL